MTVNTTKTAADGVELERKVFDSILEASRQNQVILALTTDVSHEYRTGQKSFEYFQMGNVTGFTDTPEDGNDVAGGTQRLNSLVIPSNQDKQIPMYIYDKAKSRSSIEYGELFAESAPVDFAEGMEIYMAGLMRAAANTDILCTGEPEDGYGQTLSKNDLKALARAFDDNLLPKEGRRLCVNSEQKHALISAFNLVDHSVSGDSEALRNGYVNRLYGFDIYEVQSNVLPVDDANQALAFSADALLWGVNPEDVQMVMGARDEPKSREIYKLRSTFGAKINDLPDAYGNPQNRIWLIGRGGEVGE